MKPKPRDYNTLEDYLKEFRKYVAFKEEVRKEQKKQEEEKKIYLMTSELMRLFPNLFRLLRRSKEYSWGIKNNTLYINKLGKTPLNLSIVEKEGYRLEREEYNDEEKLFELLTRVYDSL